MNRVDTKPDIARAIRRSRRTRAAIAARRRRSAAIAALLAVSLAGAGTWSICALTGADMVQAAVTQARSLADLLGQRSPGERTVALLTKTRHAKPLALQHHIAAPAVKKQPVLAPKVNMTDIGRLLEAPPPPEFGRPLAPVALLTPPSVGEIVVPPSGSPPPGGSPPGGGPPPVSNPTPPPNIIVPSAVPEPGTWATMLLGFALVGWRVRRRSGTQPQGLQA
jgi:hypothetical protein